MRLSEVVTLAQVVPIGLPGTAPFHYRRLARISDSKSDLSFSPGLVELGPPKVFTFFLKDSSTRCE
jgi:hypothetical protein